MSIKDELTPFAVEPLTERFLPSLPILATQKPVRDFKSMQIDNIICPSPHPSQASPSNDAAGLPNRHSAITSDNPASPPTPQLISHPRSPPHGNPASPPTLQLISHPRSPPHSLSPPAPSVDSHRSRESDEMEALMEPPRKSRKHATGHRRGISVDNMVPVDAATHYRRPPQSMERYKGSDLAPQNGVNSTSDFGSTPRPQQNATAHLQAPLRSQLPQHSQLNGDDSDSGEFRSCSAESDDQKYLITAEDGTVISVADSPEARKRRQNTVAARRSRQRKLEYVRSLETQLAELKNEREGLISRYQKAEERVEWLKEMLMDGRSAGRTS
ncbi:uncharacterized protein EI90DRAFT_3049613 [Cantharellus anzutake]|uniref:uncharacterized protein n=1 Tax=Cantharellus anzutake TaxID=1750568 RepID=UPI0019068B6E|nr:uncharacterized protein EI90DRAFT_3049613 [Cantharellus anzutake]KAF8334633.1 hypothetical protein EI90DRAFT_3049613 [Cantharellus anzutake]